MFYLDMLFNARTFQIGMRRFISMLKPLGTTGCGLYGFYLNGSSNNVCGLVENCKSCKVRVENPQRIRILKKQRE